MSSKNDNVVRMWHGDDPSKPIGHWCWGQHAQRWYYAVGQPIYDGDIFCLNGSDRTPPKLPPVAVTDSLEGLL